MKKNISIIIILVSILLSGCKAALNKSSEPNFKALSSKVQATINTSNMEKLDDDSLKRLYDIDKKQIENYVVYTPASNAHANELAIIKVANASDVDVVKNKISKRIEHQNQVFKGYLPDEYYLIQHDVFKSKGKYILLAISKDKDKIEQAFDSFF